MALPVTFGPLVAASTEELDQNFAAVGALTTVQCSSFGTNTITLTPFASQPTLNGYGLPNPIKFGFQALGTSTGSVSIQVSVFGFLPTYTASGVLAASGTLQEGVYYEVTYVVGALYNSGNGAWVLSSYQPASGLVAASAPKVNGLIIKNNTVTPSTKIDIAILSGCLVNSAGAPIFIGANSTTIDLSVGTVVSTANGMDGESRPASGWVYLYAISVGVGMAGLAVASTSTPNLPAGYSYFAFLGAMRCDGASNLLRSRQVGNKANYTVTAATNTAAYPPVASGAVGVISGGTFTGVAQAIAAFIPLTASTLKFVLSAPGAGAPELAGLAPSLAFAGPTSTTNPVPWYVTNLGVATDPATQVGEVLLESTNVYYASAGASGLLQAMGWTDFGSAGG